jgi:hypothetical protein
MRNRVIGALGVWLTGVGLALAQQAPEFQPARGFYYPSAPPIATPGGMRPQQPMYQTPYPAQGYPRSYPQVYPQGYSLSYSQGYQQGYQQAYAQGSQQAYPPPMYYPQAQQLRPLPSAASPIQSASYTTAGPVGVPSLMPPIPGTKIVALDSSKLTMPKAEDELPPQPEPEKLHHPETNPPPLLPQTNAASTAPAPEPVSSEVVDSGKKKAVSDVQTRTETASVSTCDNHEPGRKKWKLFRWLRKEKVAKAEVVHDDEGSVVAPAREKKRLSLWGKKDREASADVVCDDGGCMGEPVKERKRLLGKKSRTYDYADEECPTCYGSNESDDCSPHFWFAADYLAWMSKKGKIDVPLVTNGTTVVLGNDRIDYDLQQGGRLRTGYLFNDCWAIESSAFALFQRNVSQGVGSDAAGNPPLSRPFVDALTGTASAVPVSAPGVASGGVFFESSSRLYGGDINLERTICCKDHLFVSLLAGFRYLRLEEDLSVNQRTNVGMGGSFSAHDFVGDDDTFYGGQVGLSSGLLLGRVYIGASARAALGVTQQLGRFEGATVTTIPGVSSTVGPALLVTPGRRFDDDLTYVGEGQLEFGYQLTPHVSAMLGWNLLYWNRVARPGDQLSNVINRTPGQDLVSTSFWSQGLTATLGIRF